VSAPVPDLIAEGRAALHCGDPASARHAFERALADSAGGDGDAIEGLARASYLDLDYAGAIERWEQAYAIHRDDGDLLGAVRVARMLAYMHGTVVGDRAVMSGWLARAQTLVRDAPESLESGWVSLDRARFRCAGDEQEQRFRETLAVARRFGDADLECVTLGYLGASLVSADRTDEGMVMLDEALAAVMGGEVDDFITAQEIFCQLFGACEHAHDVVRADQWIRIGEAIAQRRRLPAVAAFCHTHYGAILTAAGRWPEADVALTDAVRLWGLGHRALRVDALIRLADLRVRQGRFEEAEQLIGGHDANAAAARPLAAIQLAHGQPALARDTLERALEQVDPLNSEAAPLLALLVDARLAAGLLDDAASAAGRLTACAARHGGDYLSAAAALARGRVCLAAGGGDPQAALREAVAGFARACMPMELAQARMTLATALVVERPEIAQAEARAALAAFERLQAAHHADAAAALLRSLGVRVRAPARGSHDGPLTRREAEVLELLGHGLSNPEISDRLYISRKTTEHHVGHILAKLGLRSRAEAAAYAVRSTPGER
jgi:DNA-binding NarL/FixJ family response regulator